MTGHHKFSQLTEKFSHERKAKIKEKIAKLKQEIALEISLLGGGTPCQPFSHGGQN